MSYLALSYDTIDTHLAMLRDKARLAAYSAAIKETVKPGDIVIDVGAGSGVLSILAAKAGARRVYAVEHSAISRVMRAMVIDNSVTSIVRVIAKDAFDWLPPESADVVISEPFSSVFPENGVWQAFEHIRDKALKPGGKTIPGTIRILACPIDSTDAEDTLRAVGKRVAGIDIGALGDELRGSWVNGWFSEDTLLATPQSVLSESVTANPKDLSRGAEVTVDFTAQRDGICRGVALWFESDLSPGVVLTNDPRRDRTHWVQSMIPLFPVQAVRQGDRLELKLKAPAWDGSETVMAALRVAGSTGSWAEVSRGAPAPAVQKAGTGKPAKALP